MKKFLLTIVLFFGAVSFISASGQAGGAALGALTKGLKASEQQVKDASYRAAAAAAAKAAAESTVKNKAVAGIGIPLGYSQQKDNSASAALEAIRVQQLLAELEGLNNEKIDSLKALLAKDSIPPIHISLPDSLSRLLEGKAAPADTVNVLSP